MLQNFFTSTKTPIAYAYPTLAYVASWDAFIGTQSISGAIEVFKLFHDGSKGRLGAGSGGYGLVHGDQGRFFWVYASTVPINLWKGDEITGFWDVNSPDLLTLYDFGPGPMQGDLVDLEQGLLVKHDYHDVKVYDLATGTLLRTFSEIFSGGHVYDVSWAGSGKALVSMGHFDPTGKVALINYLTGEILWQSKVNTTAKRAIYNTTHGIILTLGSDYLVRVYGTLPVPTSLSAPAFYPAVAHVHPQEGHVVRTRLLGADSEPCEGYTIAWELLGSPAKGELLKAQSRTDADGYAENYYCGPADPADLGTETVKVTATI